MVSFGNGMILSMQVTQVKEAIAPVNEALAPVKDAPTRIKDAFISGKLETQHQVAA